MFSKSCEINNGMNNVDFNWKDYALLHSIV